ncbi:hypothetical protein GBAR_LOCUS13984 [Geodia barretti]|uniref:Uncharacterized protein n=1 Tax=Geodia barretti TaxID=519541 RepID=A0AA35S5T8_GEOBA|nr:hypothetical protein GBAR_LOCUS13984 [Geodia barretti]
MTPRARGKTAALGEFEPTTLHVLYLLPRQLSRCVYMLISMDTVASTMSLCTVATPPKQTTPSFCMRGFYRFFCQSRLLTCSVWRVASLQSSAARSPLEEWLLGDLEFPTASL